MARRGDRQQLARALRHAEHERLPVGEPARLLADPERGEHERDREAGRRRPRRRARASGRSARGSSSAALTAVRSVVTVRSLHKSGGTVSLVEPPRCLAAPDSAEARVLRSLHPGVGERARDRARCSSSCSTTGPRAASGCADIREAEHEGDRLTHEVINLLNRTFVTPLDRDDMYRLASAIDDVCDHIDEAADNIDAYEVRDVPRARASRPRSSTAPRRGCTRRSSCSRATATRSKQLYAVRELEDEGDRLVREAIADLFRTEQDPLTIIRWKDIHEQIEEAVDACENAADVLEAILVKNR